VAVNVARLPELLGKRDDNEHTSHRDFDQRLALRKKYSRPSTGMNSN
jgi:hypothetical protein